MRRLSDLLLPVVGVLYPFLVYFGMSRTPPTVFAALLAAAWLVRAPSLLRRPDGRWMLGVAMLYCALLAASGDGPLLRWYPSLISLCLLAVFGMSLRIGPPMVERIARMREPDLDDAGVYYTRKVTWAWVGFFVLNATVSSALTLWASISAWTLYNGLLVYALMGLMFGGEWLLRQRMRRPA